MKKYTRRQRAFIAFTWNAKGSVVATLSGILLMKAKEERLTEEYLQYGQAMQITAMIAVLLTAPLGSAFINDNGTKYLNYDGEVGIDESDEK